MFVEKPKKTRTLKVENHPENDLLDFCDQNQIKEYKTIVGQLFWPSGLGRFDIAVHVMTMSRFRQQPRVGHLVRLKINPWLPGQFPSWIFKIQDP